MAVRIDFGELVKDAKKFCEKDARGMLIVGGSEEHARILRSTFLDVTCGKYGCIRQLRDSQEDNLYTVYLDQIELTGVPQSTS